MNTPTHTLLTALLRSSTKAAEKCVQMSTNHSCSHPGSWETSSCSPFPRIMSFTIVAERLFARGGWIGLLTPLTPAMPSCSQGIFALEFACGSAMPQITSLLKARRAGEMEEVGGFGQEQHRGKDKEPGLKQGWGREQKLNKNVR